jgi:RimJ/RimL family protein N-acetyltransferase
MTISEAQDSSLPIGVRIRSRPAKRPEPTTLTGQTVTVVPVDADAHSQTLYEQTHGTGCEQLWRYMSEGPFPNANAFHARLAQKRQSQDPIFFTILENAGSKPVGLAAYLRIEPAHRCIEVGSIVYAPSLQRTVGATEAMYLMARYVFEELAYRRYEWKCNALNEPSRRAALRLGFQFEGVFRQHMIVKGRNRDTAWFSMLDSEWPKRRSSFERWLAPSNFDASGQQKLSLSRLNNE